jgi:hypothetical protein
MEARNKIAQIPEVLMIPIVITKCKGWFWVSIQWGLRHIQWGSQFSD